jgi:predicted DNA-binding protein (UPF0251 family)
MEEFTPKEAAQRVKCTRATIWRIINKLGLGRKFGNTRILMADDVRKAKAEFKGKRGRPKGRKNP